LVIWLPYPLQDLWPGRSFRSAVKLLKFDAISTNLGICNC